MTLVNRREIARRVANRGGYNIGDIESLLKDYEDILVEALQNGEDVKQGKLFKLELKALPEKRAWDGLNHKWFTRHAKEVPRFKLLSRLEDIVHLEEEEGE